ncbi:hypothetical protein [Eoetvoesiella caeni]
MSESSSTSHHSGVYGTQRPSRTVVCPKCSSTNTQTKNHAKRIGGAIGTCAGVMSSLSSAAKGAGIGAAMAYRATASTMPLISVTAAVLCALAGGAMGCATGAALGQIVDETVLNNHLCLHCDHSFQTP